MRSIAFSSEGHRQLLFGLPSSPTTACGVTPSRRLLRDLGGQGECGRSNSGICQNKSGSRGGTMDTCNRPTSSSSKTRTLYKSLTCSQDHNLVPNDSNGGGNTPKVVKLTDGKRSSCGKA